MNSYQSQLERLIADLHRSCPQLDPPPGRMRWLKRMVLRLIHPFSAPQVAYDRKVANLFEEMQAVVEAQQAALEEVARRSEQIVQDQQALQEQLAAAQQAIQAHQATLAAQDQTKRAAWQADAQAAIEQGFFLRNVEPGAFNVLDERANWDVLILLDACRFDSFQRISRLPGRLERRISCATCTVEWIQKTFDRPCDDVVYVSGNPHVSKVHMAKLGISLPVGHLEEAWRGGWDDQLQTVLPRAVLESCVRLRGQMPGRKFIVHLMQPHQPYIGKTRLAAPSQLGPAGPVDGQGLPHDAPMYYDIVRKGLATREQLRQAYEDNVALAIEAVAEFLPRLRGKVVISADHGEMLGEYGIYDHVGGKPFPQLLEVPWLEVAAG